MEPKVEQKVEEAGETGGKPAEVKNWDEVKRIIQERDELKAKYRAVLTPEQEEVKKIIAERDELKAKYRTVDQELSAIREERKALSESKKAESRARELEGLEKSGEYKKALSKVMEEKDLEVRGLREKIVSKIVPNAISAAALAIPNLDPSAIADLPLLIGNRIRVDQESLEPYVVGDDGNPMKDGMLNPVSVNEYVAKFVQSRPRMLLDQQVRNTGLKPGPLHGDKPPRDLDSVIKSAKAMAEWADQDPDGYRQAIQDKYFTGIKEKSQKILDEARKRR
jgi:hypothetical protein